MTQRPFWRRQILLMLVFACAAVTLHAPVHAVPSSGERGAGVWFVAPDGRGDACRPSRPCELATAQRQVRQAAMSMHHDLRVVLAGGVYRLEEPIELGPSDSGRNGHRVVYEAAPGTKPVVSGGRVVRDWRRVPGTDLWRARVGDLDTRQLYVDGVRARRSASLPGIPGTVTRNDTGYHTTSIEPQAWSAPSDIELVWAGQPAGIFAWAEARCRVERITGSASGTQIDVVQPCFDNAKATYGANVVGGGELMGAPTWAENSPSFLADESRPGRWALLRSPEGNELYFRARKGEDPRRATVVAAISDGLLQVTGTEQNPVHDIVVRGLVFAESTWLAPDEGTGFPHAYGDQYVVRPDAYEPGVEDGFAYPAAAVEVLHATRIDIRDNRFERMGALAVRVEASSKVEITGNVMRDLSSGGVLIGDLGPGSGPVTDNVISRNMVEGAGVEYGGSIGIYLTRAQRTHVTQNYVANIGYTGIGLGGNYGGAGSTEQNRIANNYVSDVLRRTRDGGGIYGVSAQGPSFDKGLIVEGNLVRHGRPNEVSFGLYADLEADHTTHRNNVSYGFRWSEGGCNIPTAGHIRTEGNFLDGPVSWLCGPNTADVESAGNTQIDRSDAEAACAAIPACAEIVAGAGLPSGDAGLLAGVYGFDDVPVSDAVAASVFPVDGVHASVDFGRGQWIARYETPGYRTTTHASFATDTAGERTLTPARGLRISAMVLEGSGPYRITDGASVVTGSLRGPGRPLLVPTRGFERGAPVRVTFGVGSAVVVSEVHTSAGPPSTGGAGRPTPVGR